MTFGCASIVNVSAKVGCDIWAGTAVSNITFEGTLRLSAARPSTSRSAAERPECEGRRPLWMGNIERGKK